MKVKSLVVGMVNGVDVAMERLDKLVAQLGDVKVSSLTDTFVEEKFTAGGPTPGPKIVRVVIFE